MEDAAERSAMEQSTGHPCWVGHDRPEDDDLQGGEATIVPIDTGWVIMFVPAAGYTAAGMMADLICMVMVRQLTASSARTGRVDEGCQNWSM